MKKNCKSLPKYTLKRITDYLNELYLLKAKGITRISSRELSKMMGTTDVQVRKDLSCFDSIGKRGVGYDVTKFIKVIETELGIDRELSVIVIGVGRLGSALMHYKRLSQAKFSIIAGFDIAKEKVGKKVNGIPVMHSGELEGFLLKNRIEIAVLTLPVDEVPGVMKVIRNSDVKAVLNLTPTMINEDDGMASRNLDIVSDFKILSYKIKERANAD